MTTPQIFAGAMGSSSGVDIGDNIPNSLLLDSSLSQGLNIQIASKIGTSPYKKTYLFTVKRGKLGTQQCLLGGYQDPNNIWFIGFLPNDTINLYCIGTGGIVTNKATTAVFRDASAHYDILVTADTTLVVAEDRVQLHINGTRITSFTTNVNPAQNSYSGAFPLGYTGLNYSISLGSYPTVGHFFDGYYSRAIGVDGQALPATAFGRFSPDTGEWVPKNYAGTYGTNGFKLEFLNGTALGTDTSGNGNNWTVNGGITSANQYSDTPTNNYCVLNPLASVGTQVISKGGLRVLSTSFNSHSFGSLAMPATGKYYFEATCTTLRVQGTTMVGLGHLGDTIIQYRSNGQVFNGGGAAVTTVAPYTVNDTVALAVDVETGQFQLFKNGVLQSTLTASRSLIGARPYHYFGDSIAGSESFTDNFGARPFAYTPPAGFKALCTANLPTPAIIKPKKHFDVLLHTGDGSAGKTITVALFKPGLAWVKGRSLVAGNILMDSARTAGKLLMSDSPAAESGNAGDLITSFNADGLTVNNTYLGAANGSTNQNGQAYVDWLWKMGGAAVTNNAGSISSQVSADVEAGQSIVTYTGTGASATVGHGLSKAPELVIVKNRTTGNGWGVWHSALTATQALQLESTAAIVTSATYWNSTLPSSSVVSVGTWGRTNESASGFVAYCFHSIEGFSKIGKYTGNGSADGPFVYCGFKPKYVLIKRTDSPDKWYVWDTARSTINPMGNVLIANQSAAEYSAGALLIDATATGFKLRDTVEAWNTSGGTYIFYAIADIPAKYSRAK